MDEIIDTPLFSGKLQNIFPNGTIEYDGQIGLPARFPLTAAEKAEVAAALSAPYVGVVTQDDLVKAFKDAIQARLDSAARAKGYDNIVSACSYAGYENVFQGEAIAFGQWRANVWAYGYAELDKVLNGVRPMPTVEQIVSELPDLTLP